MKFMIYLSGAIIGIVIFTILDQAFIPTKAQPAIIFDKERHPGYYVARSYYPPKYILITRDRLRCYTPKSTYYKTLLQEEIMIKVGKTHITHQIVCKGVESYVR